MTITYKCKSCGFILYQCCERWLDNAESHVFAQPNFITKIYNNVCPKCNATLDFKSYSFCEANKFKDCIAWSDVPEILRTNTLLDKMKAEKIILMGRQRIKINEDIGDIRH